MAGVGFKERFARCCDCEKIYTQKAKKQIRCPECQKKYRAEQVKQKKDDELRRSDYRAWLIKHDSNVCSKVRACTYGNYVGGLSFCDYWGKTGNRRPCPVKDCTVFKRRTGREKKNNGFADYRLNLVSSEYSYNAIFDVEDEVRL